MFLEPNPSASKLVHRKPWGNGWASHQIYRRFGALSCSIIVFAILLHGQCLPDTYEQSAKSVTLDMAIPSLNLTKHGTKASKWAWCLCIGHCWRQWWPWVWHTLSFFSFFQKLQYEALTALKVLQLVLQAPPSPETEGGECPDYCNSLREGHEP